MDRLEALDCKFPIYDSVEVCRKCKGTLRYTKNMRCVACWREVIKKKPSVRQLAKVAGQITYQTGKPCKHGHNAPRFTSTGGCSLCVNPVKPYVTVRLQVHALDVPALEAYATALRLTRPPV